VLQPVPPWGVLTGRLDLAQVSMLTRGGAAFRLFPTLGLDVMVEPPTDWRVKPRAWVGGRAIAYMKPDALYHDSEVHWRYGLGGKFTLTRHVELFAEVQMYASDAWFDDAGRFPDGTHFASWTSSVVGGLFDAETDARFALGK
jgi:hypothetical protein